MMSMRRTRREAAVVVGVGALLVASAAASAAQGVRIYTFQSQGLVAPSPNSPAR